MNKRNLFALTTVLAMCSTNFMFSSAATAQVSSETQQLINETDALLKDAGEFLQYTEQQRQQEMNALSSACNNGDSNACTQYQLRINAENRAIDNYTETIRNRRLCGSPVCY